MFDLKNTLKTLKLNESTVSVVLGAVVVLLVGILALRFFNSMKATTGSLTEQAAQESSQTTSSETNIPAGGTTHIVAQGESLWTISQKYFKGSGYNWVDIASANKLADPGLIHVGDKLTIPSVSVREPKVATVTTARPITVSGASYTTVKGDSLWKIAVAAYGDGYQWTKIWEANKVLIGNNPNRIYSGSVLEIPR